MYAVWLKIGMNHQLQPASSLKNHTFMLYLVALYGKQRFYKTSEWLYFIHV